MTRTVRARNSITYRASVAHRLSGLALSLFLPLHFLMLGLAFGGKEAFDRGLALAEIPLVKVAEWGLVVFLALHLLLGLRVLALEFLPWGDTPDQRDGWIVWGGAGALGVGVLFIFAAL